jgi:hypothetical protein
MSVISLTSRDLELLKKLSSHGMLSTKQVGQLFFPGVAITTVLRRLRLLEASFYVRRILGLESQEALWVLAAKGALEASVPLPKRHWSKNMLEHDFKLLSLRLAMESIGVSKSWMPEHIIRSSIFEKYGLLRAKDKLVPDGFMAVEVDGIKHSIAIEVELTIKSRKRYLETFRRYSEKEGISGVWYLGRDKGILNQVRRNWYSSNREIRLYCSFIDEVLQNPLEARLLSKSGHELIKNLWRRSVLLSTHGVSTQEHKRIIRESNTSADNHTPILKDAS